MSNISLKGKSFLKLLDFTTDEIRYLLELSKDLKQKKKNGIKHDELKGKKIVLLFEKTPKLTLKWLSIDSVFPDININYLYIKCYFGI